MVGARLAALILSRAETVEEEEAVDEVETVEEVAAAEEVVDQTGVEDDVVIAAAAKALIDFDVWVTFGLSGGVLGTVVTLGDLIGDRSCGGRPGKRGSFSSFFFFGSNFGTVDRAACKDCLE